MTTYKTIALEPKDYLVLKQIKYEINVDSFGEAVHKLIEEHRNKQEEIS